MSPTAIDRARISRAVKKVAIAKSDLDISPETVSDREPLNGSLLRVTSFALVGMLIDLEDELGVTLADDLFVGRTFATVDDIVDVIDGTRGRV